MHTALTVTKQTPSRPCLIGPRGIKENASAQLSAHVLKQGKRVANDCAQGSALFNARLAFFQEVRSNRSSVLLNQPGLGVVVRIDGRIHVVQLVAVKHPVGGVDVRRAVE